MTTRSSVGLPRAALVAVAFPGSGRDGEVAATVTDIVDFFRDISNQGGTSMTQCTSTQPSRTWLAANPRVVVHFTPTHASWMNLVEVWLSIIERQAIHRGTFTSVTDLNAMIRAFITAWNNNSHPFVWTKTTEQILKKANRKKTSDAGH